MDNQPNQFQSQSASGGSKTSIWVLIIVVIVIIAGGAYYFLTQDDTTNTNNTNSNNTTVNTVANANENTNAVVNENTNTETNTNEVANTNTNSSVDTSNWNTYKNTEYGFLFKYPETWYLKDFTDIDQRTSLSAVFGTNEITSLGDIDTVFNAEVQTLQLNNNGFTASDISAEFEILITSSETFTIDGYNAIQYTAQTDSSTTSGLVVLIDSDNNQVVSLVSQSSVASEDVAAIFNSLTVTK